MEFTNGDGDDLRGREGRDIFGGLSKFDYLTPTNEGGDTLATNCAEEDTEANLLNAG